MPANSKSSPRAVAALMALFAVAVVGDDIDSPIFQHLTQEQVTFKVTHRERVNANDSSRYMIWATKEDGSEEVFQDTDSWAFLKFNSADLYGKMQEGATVTANVAGWRVPFMSWNRNIISAKQVTATPQAVPKP